MEQVVVKLSQDNWPSDPPADATLEHSYATFIIAVKSFLTPQERIEFLDCMAEGNWGETFTKDFLNANNGFGAYLDRIKRIHIPENIEIRQQRLKQSTNNTMLMIQHETTSESNLPSEKPPTKRLKTNTTTQEDEEKME